MTDLRQESIDAQLRQRAAELADHAVREARHEGARARSSGADLATEHTITLAAMAMREAGVEARASSAIASFCYRALEAAERARLEHAAADAARTARNATYAAEDAKRDAEDREAARQADMLEARRHGREWRRKGLTDIAWIVARVTSNYPRLAEHEASIRAGYLDEDERIANPQRQGR